MIIPSRAGSLIFVNGLLLSQPSDYRQEFDHAVLHENPIHESVVSVYTFFPNNTYDNPPYAQLLDYRVDGTNLIWQRTSGGPYYTTRVAPEMDGDSLTVSGYKLSNIIEDFLHMEKRIIQLENQLKEKKCT